MNIKSFKGKKVNIILTNMHLLIGELKKVPILPIWHVGNKFFVRRQVSKIYLANY